MARRKTVKVDDIVRKANGMLAYNAKHCPDHAEQRRGVIALLESILRDTENYRGFHYLDGHEAVTAGTYDETARGYYWKGD